MFEGDWDELDAAATLRAAAEFDADENHAALGKLHAALRFADLHGELPATTQHERTAPGRQRLTVHGGAGCPAIAEFAPAEFAAVLGLSTATGAARIGEALALRHRFPKTWARTQAEQAPVWRARTVARSCISLSVEAAAYVDHHIVGAIDTLPTSKFYELLHALIKRADPEAAHRAAEQHAKDRGVFVNPSDGEGTKTIYVKAATGDVIRFDATINDLAQAMATIGDTDTLNERRAKAIGWIADPEAAHHLLTTARYLASQQPTSAGTDAATTTQDSEGGDEGEIVVPAAVDDHDDWFPDNEPGPDDEADRDTPHPSIGGHLDHLDHLSTRDILKAIDRQAWKHPRPPHPESTGDRDEDAFSWQELAGKLAAIKQAAHTTSTGGRGRPQTVLYVHLTDQSLQSGDGIARIEQHGPLLVSRLRELLGHDQVVLKPVINLNKPINVNAYEIPSRIREHVKLAHPVEQFPYGTTETTFSTDLDHIQPYDPNGPPGQTGTDNITPLGRLHHRLKTHGGWRVDRLDDTTLRWITPNGFQFRVDYSGTHPIATDPPNDDIENGED